jgi:phosphoserine aminotransferase
MVRDREEAQVSGERIVNFGAGPATLPEPVLQKVQSELMDYQGVGMSVMEISHRSDAFAAIQTEAEQRLRRLMNISSDYEILFLQGGASLQFAMLPLNMLADQSVGAYVLTGTWSEKAYAEAARVGKVRVAASTEADGYRRTPRMDEIVSAASDGYIHVTSNNTIVGSQYQTFPLLEHCPVVADMSSDILSRPFNVNDFHMIYAGAQKNLGPAGVTLVIVRKDWITSRQIASDLPSILRYDTHIKGNSKYNTPPVFSIYVMGLVLEWIESQGGVNEIAKRNSSKAEALYAAIDDSQGFYEGVVHPDSRSVMNVTFRLPNSDIEQSFVQEAKQNGFVGIKGHRSVGGCRVSLYNAVTVENAHEFAGFMRSFHQRHV